MISLAPINSSPIVIKLGGSALNDPKITSSLSRDVAQASTFRSPLLVVHGGGPAINEELTFRGISWEFHQGQRITTDEMMDTIEMVLCGKVNRQIVRSINSYGISAIGLSGTDANILLCNRYNGVLGNVGAIQTVNVKFLSALMMANPGMVPVIAPVGTDGNGNALNVNADWAASKIAQSMGTQTLIYLTDQDGILDANGTLIQDICSDELSDLIQLSIVKGGMLAKVNTIISALQCGIENVYIVNAKQPEVLLKVLTGEIVGTRCRPTTVRQKIAIQ